MLILFILLIALTTFLLIKFVYSYWKRNGVPEIAPIIPFGCMLPFIKKEKTAGKAMADTYYQSNEPFVGVYVFFMPELLIRDLELIRKIMIEDFEFFTDHDNYINEEFDPFSANLFSQTGEKWRTLRQRFTPLFTTAKLKSMYPLVLQEVDKLDEHLEKMAKHGQPVDLENLFLSYILNLVASLFFGLVVDTIKEPEHPIKKIFDIIVHCPNALESFRRFSIMFFPKILKTFRLHGHSAESRDYFMNLVKTTIEHRTKENISRNDMFQVLMELHEKDEDFSIEEVAGSSYNFFQASCDTSTTLGLRVLYELCKQPELLKKAQLEVRKVISNNNGGFTYSAVGDIHYIDLVIKEILRMNGALPVYNRVATRDYKVPGHNFTIKKGTTVLLPIDSIHKDEKYFTKPLDFIPERFEKDSNMYNERAFFPIGAGPRNCPAWKLGYLMTKLVMVKILYKYDVELITKDFKINTSTVFGVPKEPILFNLQINKQMLKDLRKNK